MTSLVLTGPIPETRYKARFATRKWPCPTHHPTSGINWKSCLFEIQRSPFARELLSQMVGSSLIPAPFGNTEKLCPTTPVLFISQALACDSLFSVILWSSLSQERPGSFFRTQPSHTPWAQLCLVWLPD